MSKFLDRTGLKTFADDIVKMVKMMSFVSDGVENIVGKGENAGNHHFLLFPLFLSLLNQLVMYICSHTYVEVCKSLNLFSQTNIFVFTSQGAGIELCCFLDSADQDQIAHYV